jgi:hypothetical protein
MCRFLDRPMSRQILVIAAIVAVPLTISGCRNETKPETPARASSQAPALGTVERSGPSQRLKISRRQSDRPAGEHESFECSRFEDVAARSGLSHVYLNGASGQFLMVETTGGGCGWIDFDRDGHWDLYLNQGGDPVAGLADSRPSDQLFRNRGDGRFAAVTTLAGIDERGYSQGVAVGDFNDDGFDDVYVTNVGGNVLYQNSGDGTFQNVTVRAGVGGGLWSTSAAWADLDLDGDLDLYVCNYLDYDPYHPRICQNSRGRAATCHPDKLEPVPDECYLNIGDGTFRPVARERGLVGPGNKALGVAIADFDNDGWPDVFVANDTTPNFLFINEGHGFFRESAVVLGCAVNTNGSPQANMGIAVGDYDRNGWLDIYVTHFTSEWNTLYRNRGPEGFQDISALVGLVPPKLDKLGFGTIMADFNYDGYDELIVGNGHVNDNRDQGAELEMITQLFAWHGERWHECTAQAGAFFERKLLARGLACGDYDNDGDIDVVVVAQNVPVALLDNQSHLGNWLKLEFVGRSSNRRGIGTRVIASLGDRCIVEELAGGTSYCSTNQPALFFGLGEWNAAVELEIRWPSGVVQRVQNVLPNQGHVLIEPTIPE